MRIANSIFKNAFQKTLFCLFFGIGFSTWSQQPAYFLHGENQFEGVHIYDVIQDQDLNYWFATSEGIIKYDSYTYEEIECPKMKGSSVFNFVINSKGTIYCANLNNQIFELKNNVCKLFYELDEKDGASDISLLITPEDNLWVGAKFVFILDYLGKVVDKFTAPYYSFGSQFAFRTAGNKIVYSVIGTDSMVIYTNARFEVHEIKCDEDFSQIPNQAFTFFKIEEKNYSLDRYSKSLYIFDEDKIALTKVPKHPISSSSESIRLYATNNQLWLASTLPGISLITNIENPNTSPVFYSDFFISDVFVDSEGNTLLSTFDKGILVIPNMQIPDLINIENHDQIVSVVSDKSLGVLLGTSAGKLLIYHGYNYEVIVNTGSRSIVSLYSHEDFPYVLFDNGKIRAYNKETRKILDIHSGSLKDAVHIDKETFYIATNTGIYKMTQNNSGSFDVQEIIEINQRTYGIEYDHLNQQLYTSTANGLRLLDLNGIVSEVTYHNQQIYSNHLLFFDGDLYCATKNNGILIIKQGEVAAQIMPQLNNEYIEIVKFVIHNNSIFAKTKKGLLQFDMNGKVIRQINKDLGFSSNRIIDFDVSENILWISHSEGVQKLNFDLLKTKIETPLIKITTIVVNGLSQPTKEPAYFESNQRRIEFTISSPTLKNRENITYHHKLLGYDNQWSINKYDNHKITYNALSYGDYTFVVKAENQGVFSKIIYYSFTIKTPYYYTWWFTSLWIILFLIFIMLIYRRLLRIQQNKLQYANELNLSKLTAIQSQMNPHFIFNSLNSIQDLILKGDVENSYSYISTFSDLVRRTLNYSDKDFIDFEQEVKLLELYLSLEKLRFKKDFNYKININDVRDILIPPMLIQPFIENALVHGLLHRSGAKNLSITFNLHDSLVCIIEDNGVGREAASEIKIRQHKQHDSFSVQAIKKRFEILSNHFEGELGYDYEDLTEDNSAIGTRVRLRIPFQYKF